MFLSFAWMYLEFTVLIVIYDMYFCLSLFFCTDLNNIMYTLGTDILLIQLAQVLCTMPPCARGPRQQ